MSEEKKKPEDELDVLAKYMQAILGTTVNTRLFAELLTNVLDDLDGQMTSVVENADRPDRRLAYIVGMKTAYRQLRNGALRALELSQGKPPEGEKKESTGGEPI